MPKMMAAPRNKPKESRVHPQPQIRKSPPRPALGPAQNKTEQHDRENDDEANASKPLRAPPRRTGVRVGEQNIDRPKKGKWQDPQNVSNHELEADTWSLGVSKKKPLAIFISFGCRPSSLRSLPLCSQDADELLEKHSWT
jgi:hypothetical protein